jgi:hypothetical protein
MLDAIKIIIDQSRQDGAAPHSRHYLNIRNLFCNFESRRARLTFSRQVDYIWRSSGFHFGTHVSAHVTLHQSIQK